MELARAERELSKPTNWGEKIYWNLKTRESETVELNLLGLPPLALNSTVRDALERHPTAVGPLDATYILSELSDDEQCVFFGQYPKVQTVIMRYWTSVSLSVLRCISITSGGALVELDFSFASVQAQHLQVILVRADVLEILRLDSSSADQGCAKVIAQLAHRNLRELYVNKCAKFGDDALQWIGGCAGVSSQSLSRLRCLDLGDGPVGDAGLLAIAKGCKKVTFLNLENCSVLTDRSVVEIAKACCSMQLANLSGCNQLTNRSVVAMGKSWKDLQSVNLSRCPLISDKGIKALAMGCKRLQAVNIAGLLKISEESMFCLADQCNGLLTLNLTGCERVTMNGVDHLVKGLQYVEKAITFLGFKPIDHHTEAKLANALKMVVTRDSKAAEAERLALLAKEAEEEANRARIAHNAVCTLQAYLFRYKCRMHFFRLWRLRVHTTCVSLLQRVYRGYRGRCKAIVRRGEVAEFRSKSPFALKIQKTVRAYLCRLKHDFVSKRIRELYIMRGKEVESAMVVRLQAQGRRYLSLQRVAAWRELRQRNRLNVHDAMVLMQKLARKFLSVMKVTRKRNAKIKMEDARHTAGWKIKVFCVEGMARYKSRLSGEALRKFYLKKWEAATVVQRLFRGHRGRQGVRWMRIREATEYYAAREIQRIYRGAMVLHWKDMRLNVVAAFVLDRHYVERREALIVARKRFVKFTQDNLQDSASEPDDEDFHDLIEYGAWVKEYDAKKKRHYWQNHVSQQITYDEPRRPLAHELGLVDKRIRVYWVVQAAWYEGTISRYHKRKGRHRVEYDDGDHEWINCEAECERIQIQLPDGAWVMYLLYQTEEKMEELRKADEKANTEAYKATAFRDALQWKAFTDDTTGEVMFLSQINGELRTGAPFAMDWVVQDDGFGFPCFSNTITGAVMYEDPRFTYDVDDDLLQQRKFVMQELRYAVYVCKALWEDYQAALAVQDPHQIHRMLMKIRNSPKCVHLNAFLIRAKALYKPASVVDKPMELAVTEELEYITWLGLRIAEVQDQAEDTLRNRRDHKAKVVDKLTANSGQRVYCKHCGRETKKHLEFCATCGKSQLFFDTKPRTKSSLGTMVPYSTRGSADSAVAEEDQGSSEDNVSLIVQSDA